MSWSRAVVTGGAGFIGSHLCTRLIDEGEQVVCVDNLSTGRLDHVAHLLEHRNFTLVRHDITVPLDLPADALYNLACPASPAHYQADPVHTSRPACSAA